MATSGNSRRRRGTTTTSKTIKSGSREQVSHGSIRPLASSNLLIILLRLDDYMYLIVYVVGSCMIFSFLHGIIIWQSVYYYVDVM